MLKHLKYSILLVVFNIFGSAQATIERIELNTGTYMPVLGLGTWQNTNETELVAALTTALDNGYRLIDTAFLYNNEAVIGKVLKEYIDSGKVKREDIFITTKLPFTAHDPNDVEECVNTQLKRLQLDYIDLYLIHCPLPLQKANDSFDAALANGVPIPVTIDHVDTWHALEKLYDAGKLKALGLSNFNASQIRNVYDKARVKPANLQVECHLYWPQTELHELCKELNMSFTAYAPLGSRGRKASNPQMVWPEGDPMSEPVVQKLAAKHNKTAAQIMLRHLHQRGMIVIPKTSKPERVKENMDIFDFSLSDEEMKELNDIKTRKRFFLFDIAIGHPFYPFGDVDQTKYKVAPLHP
ncbi:unnamed protein product [Cylicocyclus nassatus]|uniref:NADP-dependent oxidoreductase domain-containing protein n=1 Tax=Cylicocyclus nassatus TaxID=53992 RepID=A0AA36GID0_CYLNA|nr:unnamed protein product [Cylicocyclus nassatus]